MIEFRHDGTFWLAELNLPFWSGYRNRVEVGSLSAGSSEIDVPQIELVFAPEGRGSDPLSEDELSLVQTFVETERQISLAVRAAIYANYGNWQRIYGYAGEEKARLMPDITRPDELRDLITLQEVFVHQVSSNGTPYVGYNFDCSWDSEHGLGILMSGTRTVKTGGADTAFLLWIAEQDLQG